MGEVGVRSANPYMFALPGKDESYQNAWQALNRLVKGADLEFPEFVTSTKLRKYLATSSQILAMDKHEREWLANHLSHSVAVHDHYYRLPSNAVELAKISKLLLITERGNLHQHQGQSIAALNVDNLDIEDPDQQQDEEEHQEQESDEDEKPPAGIEEEEDETPRRLRRQLPEGTRKEILQYFEASISAKKPPNQAECKKYLEEHQSTLEWTRVKAVINSRIQLLRNKERKRTSNHAGDDRHKTSRGADKKRKLPRKKEDSKRARKS